MDKKGRVLPELISGPRSGLAWVVRECLAMDARVSIADGEQAIQVPGRVLKQDGLVQKHELTHVADLKNMERLPKDKHGRRFFKMLCEVAVEARSLYRDGYDIRQARDHLDWSSFPLPEQDDMTAWAQLWLQFTFSADTSEHPAIKRMYQRACDTLGADRVAWLVQARDAVVVNYDSGEARLRWADWLGKCFPRHADTPPPPPPEKPKPEESEEQEQEPEDSTGNDGELREGEGEPTAPPETDQSEQSQEETDEGEDDASDDERDGDEPDSTDDSDSGAGDDSGDGDDDGDRDTGDSGDDAVETTDTDDDRWKTPSEQVQERVGAGRIRAHKEQEQDARDFMEEQKRAIDNAWNPDAEHGMWVIGGAKIDIHRHTATRAGRKLQGRGERRASDTGSRVVAPRRLYQDGRVLARTGRVGGGILVDGSGSMAWSQPACDRAVAILPGLWVGWYSLHQEAYDHTETMYGTRRCPTTSAEYERWRHESPYWARLCIIAERGKVADFQPRLEADYHSGGNEVDGDCLSYFARCVQGPKVWVSDGQVYGAPGHALQCARVMKQHRIVRVDTVEDAVRYLEGKPVMGYKDCSSRQHKLVKG